MLIFFYLEELVVVSCADKYTYTEWLCTFYALLVANEKNENENA